MDTTIQQKGCRRATASTVGQFWVLAWIGIGFGWDFPAVPGYLWKYFDNTYDFPGDIFGNASFGNADVLAMGPVGDGGELLATAGSIAHFWRWRSWKKHNDADTSNGGTASVDEPFGVPSLTRSGTTLTEVRMRSYFEIEQPTALGTAFPGGSFRSVKALAVFIGCYDDETCRVYFDGMDEETDGLLPSSADFNALGAYETESLGKFSPYTAVLDYTQQLQSVLAPEWMMVLTSGTASGQAGGGLGGSQSCRWSPNVIYQAFGPRSTFVFDEIPEECGLCFLFPGGAENEPIPTSTVTDWLDLGGKHLVISPWVDQEDYANDFLSAIGVGASFGGLYSDAGPTRWVSLYDMLIDEPSHPLFSGISGSQLPHTISCRGSQDSYTYREIDTGANTDVLARVYRVAPVTPSTPTPQENILAVEDYPANTTSKIILAGDQSIMSALSSVEENSDQCCWRNIGDVTRQCTFLRNLFFSIGSW